MARATPPIEPDSGAGHTSPPDAAPHYHSPGLDITHRQTHDTISSLLRLGRVRRRDFMELAHLAGELDPRIVPIIEDWDRMKPPLQNAVDLDALCEAHDVDPAHFISVVGEAGLKYRDNASVLVAAMSLPRIIEKSVKRALSDDGPQGFKYAEALMKHAGFLPHPKGSQLGTLNYAAIRAEVNTNIGEPLPTFEETIADLDELTGDEE